MKALTAISLLVFSAVAGAQEAPPPDVRALEQRAELVRIRKRVDPNLEVSAIADRVMKSGGPALLFEDVGGSPFPLLINAYGSRRRMSMAMTICVSAGASRRRVLSIHSRRQSAASLSSMISASSSWRPRRLPA